MSGLDWLPPNEEPGATRGPARAYPPWRAWVAATIAVVYAVALLGMGLTLVFEFVTGSGHVGHLHLSGYAERGVLQVSALLIGGAGCLLAGAVRLVRQGRPALLLAPLVFLLVFGSIGEVVDLIGSASPGSDFMGAAVLVLAATPVVLLRPPRRR